MRRSGVAMVWALGSMVVGIGGCLDEGQRRDGSPGIGFEDPEDLPVERIEVGEYGPVADYLVHNANSPIPEADPAEPEAGDGDGDGSCDGFACNDGLCIDAHWQCDGIVDCAGGEDEAGCPGGDDGGDGADGCDGFQCNDGKCISPNWVCDDIVDCAGGEDEAGCGGGDGGDPACTGFECDDGKCIDASWVCDGIVDCAGGEDEAACSHSAPAPTLGTAPRTSESALACIAAWTGAGAGAGALAAKAVSSSCASGGVVVGFVSGGSGFAAATVCFGANVSNADSIVGGILGAVSGLVGGVWSCEGNALAEAGAALEHLLSTGTIPTFQVEHAEGDQADTTKCGVPAHVDRANHAECGPLYEDMKEFGWVHDTSCNDVNVAQIPDDPAAIAAACSDIRRRFSNAAEYADRRLQVGSLCYPNGNEGPMGNSDYGHQVQWCQVHRSMQKCVEKARHPKLDCSLTQTMAQHSQPTGCENLLACNPNQAGV
jgi:hypothetical protein